MGLVVTKTGESMDQFRWVAFTFLKVSY